MTEAVLILLSVVMIASNVLWAFLCVQLMDRLMSRNYLEFKQGKVMGKPEPEVKRPDELVVDPIDQLQAQEMNALVGIV